MHAFLLVGLGGAMGAMARYGVARLFGLNAFPVATLVINVSGGLLMGVLVGVLTARAGGVEWVRLLLGVGVLGGFTTFSAFSLDVIVMMERGAHIAAFGYAMASVVLSVGALGLGLLLARWFMA